MKAQTDKYDLRFSFVLQYITKLWLKNNVSKTL